MARRCIAGYDRLVPPVPYAPMKIKLLPKCLSSTSTLSQSPAVFPQRFPQRSVCHMTICCALLRSLVHFDVDKRGRRAYNTWDEGRKKTQANSNQKAPIRPSTARAPRGQLTCRVQNRLGNLEFLAAEAPPQSTGMGGRVQKANHNNPTTRADY